MSQIIVGNADITDYVVADSYRMDSENTYESWTDGNYVEHRIIARETIKGEFNVVLSSKNDMPLSQFMTIWNSATTNGVTRMTVYVTNKATTEAIEAYCTLESQQHEKISDGSFLDVLKITVEER